MYKQSLLITLQEACVLSQRNATEGAHRGLDYITGSSLFGAVASKLYGKEGIDSFQLFHSGKVRFRNAYPINNKKETTYPMPLCWYAKKEQPAISDNSLEEDKIWRLDLCEDQALPNNAQPAQLRNGFFSLSGNLADVKRNFQLKTAINEETKRAKEEELFAYESIQKGQQFYCEIEADDENDLTKVSETLAKGILIGRSRSAEYGKAQISLIKAVSTEEPAENQTDITLWCLSDAMIYDDTGQITLAPSAKSIGLSEDSFTLDITRSHIRARSYSAWNQHKQAYELEKQVIEKGSVLVYKAKNTENKEETAAAIEKLQKGIGVDKTLGLGHVWVNPPLLNTEQPSFSDTNAIADDSSDESSSSTAPESKPEPEPLIQWLDNTAGKSHSNELQAAREDIKIYKDVLLSVEEVENKAKTEDLGPSRSQWGALLQQAKLIKGNDEGKLNALFNGDSSVCGNSGWSDRYQLENDKHVGTIKTFVKNCVDKQEKEKINKPRYLQFFAREAMSISRKGGAK